jgi:hypothetical protein
MYYCHDKEFVTMAPQISSFFHDAQRRISRQSCEGRSGHAPLLGIDLQWKLQEEV